MKLTTYFSRCFIILVLAACLIIAQEVGRLKRAYKPSNATLINRGHDMMDFVQSRFSHEVKYNLGIITSTFLRWLDVGHIQINGTLFQLRQCHLHSPSEHTIDGRSFNMEIHLVYQSNDNRTSVIGIMYKIGCPDSFLAMMKPNFEAVVEKRNLEIDVGIIDPKLIKFGSRKYYRFIGSLTTPPCSPNVIWTILRKLIRDAVHDESEANARPLQPIRDRVVELYRPRDREN
ncbi:Carbonic anhydrase [Handroanthus impetiginosus]|uniref:Carbonic anhydrase n=1 Tax=Handroanthus impetiginosus TaxID=429701 RepID=A0A2G9H0J1_9LAMI|nr:Carbonic anhydrase [Handroanthus impetiginosus]